MFIHIYTLSFLHVRTNAWQGLILHLPSCLYILWLLFFIHILFLTLIFSIIKHCNFIVDDFCQIDSTQMTYFPLCPWHLQEGDLAFDDWQWHTDSEKSYRGISISSLGLGRIWFILPDAAYPAELSGMPCRICRLIQPFLAGCRVADRMIRQCRIFGPT